MDGLHEAAGSRRLCALHGRIADVVCLGCRSTTSRAALAARLDDLNPDWQERHGHVASRPDGDVDLDETDGFEVPGCESCGGVLKPDVVFFGENVPKPRVRALLRRRRRPARRTAAPCWCSARRSRSCPASGSCARAAKLGVPVVIVNRGGTRADDLATVKLHVGTSEFLAELSEAQGAPAH